MSAPDAAKGRPAPSAYRSGTGPGIVRPMPLNRFVPTAALLVAITSALSPAARPATRPTVFKGRVTPHWTDATHFWYRNDLPGGRREIVTVDAEAAVRTVVDAPPAATSRPTAESARAPATTPTIVPTPREASDDHRDFTRPIRSPDGTRVLLVRDNNIRLGTSEADTKSLTTDGTNDFPYDRVFWSPDGRAIVAYRMKCGDHLPVYRLESSPRAASGRHDGGAGRAALHTDEYALPGDKLDTFEMNVIDPDSGKQTKPKVDPIDTDASGSHPDPRPQWRKDGRHFTYQKYDRGHQRVRLIEIDSHTGDARTILDEKSDTFIWTAHTDDPRLWLFHFMDNDRDVIYVSERSGWRQLYLLNLDTTELKPITSGQWVLRGMHRVDQEKRQIWFSASGVYPGQDPYLIHYGRVNFDGSGLVWLTDARGTHTIDFRRPELHFSPDWAYLIVTHSRVDLPPVTELRRTSDGKLVMTLEDATVVGDAQPIEPFVAKGRDGKTDIYGVICRPSDFDPNKKYPVLENVYAGPQGAYVPKAYRPTWYYQELADRGFIVVQADGMGTAERGKAFHDVCWQNLADAGFPDRIAWIQAAAAKYPQMDVTRVGIYGTSAGGQTACGALLLHNDFYKAAVANCGCHDNRMDKITWNEQWMGWPVGPQYSASSNIDNAAKLKGRLQLVLGELDDNVPVESTYRLVNALVQAGKEFEFVVIPGAGHGASSPITNRKLGDFFVRYLQGVEPANPN